MEKSPLNMKMDMKHSKNDGNGYETFKKLWKFGNGYEHSKNYGHGYETYKKLWKITILIGTHHL